MSGVDSGFWIGMCAIVVASVWVLLVLRPWRHPQHAARYRPDPVKPPALDDTITFAPVAGRPPWDLEVAHDVHEDPLPGQADGEDGPGQLAPERWLTAPEAGAEGVPLPGVQWMAPDLAQEVTARASFGELVYGTAGGMGCDSGAMAAVRDDAGLELEDALIRECPVCQPGQCPGTGPGCWYHQNEATLRRELALVDQLDLPGEDGPALPPAGPDGAGCESEGPGLTAPPAPVPWLERELGYLDDWARRMRAEWEL